MRRRLLSSGSRVTLTLSSDSYTSSPTNTSNEFTVYCDGVVLTDPNVSINCSDNFCTASWDSTNGKVILTYSINPLCSDRSSTITINYEGVKIKFTLTLTASSVTATVDRIFMECYANDAASVSLILNGDTNTPYTGTVSVHSSGTGFYDYFGYSTTNGVLTFYTETVNTDTSVPYRSGLIRFRVGGSVLSFYLYLVNELYASSHYYIQFNDIYIATMNIGANHPTECGTKFLWGAGATPFVSESNNDYYVMSLLNEVLPSDRDTATLIWGSEWRMPTLLEIPNKNTFGSNNCFMWDAIYRDVPGYAAQPKNGGYFLFIPLNCKMWSSSGGSISGNNQYAHYVYNGTLNTDKTNKGNYVRPIRA